jgi:Carboxyl transferase domain
MAWGVENLMGSSLIVGDAYDETFTLSLATARSVGVGAYLVFGQRVLQKENISPIILSEDDPSRNAYPNVDTSDHYDVQGPKYSLHSLNPRPDLDQTNHRNMVIGATIC